jgi:hypothetical protein
MQKMRHYSGSYDAVCTVLINYCILILFYVETNKLFLFFLFFYGSGSEHKIDAAPISTLLVYMQEVSKFKK